ncbi:S-M checkpoint control rad4 [Micractinium conductrix]|uniref:S-M checkpoint control rad4 n=1 Tax=Micractinium conductrix TaxID=554055 RepID=A0A2P6V950_9CHLO|nr:S-M checkpoint control rad4 [Micractinium conductrix]|eukprot:PSC70616.1 S-M checkpoint control rad4 [Micractinium conductrix]
MSSMLSVPETSLRDNKHKRKPETELEGAPAPTRSYADALQRRPEAGGPMRGVVLCVDGYSLENQVMYKSWVESLGGAYTGDLSGTSTHLIVPDAKGDKFDACKRFGVTPVTSDWLANAKQVAAPSAQQATIAEKQATPDAQQAKRRLQRVKGQTSLRDAGVSKPASKGGRVPRGRGVSDPKAGSGAGGSKAATQGGAAGSGQATAGACLPTSGEHVVEAAKKGGLQSTLLKLTNKKPAEVQGGGDAGKCSAAGATARSGKPAAQRGPLRQWAWATAFGGSKPANQSKGTPDVAVRSEL